MKVIHALLAERQTNSTSLHHRWRYT